MKTSASLCFTKDGIANPNSIGRLEQTPGHDTLVLFGDGSLEAVNHMMAFADHELLKTVQFDHIGIGITPQFEMRITKPDGELSRPHFVYDEPTMDQWICAKVVAPRLQVSVSDISSRSETQAVLEPHETEAVCYQALNIWKLLQIVEQKLCFPAMAIDTLMRWTHNLTAQTIDVEMLRKETGLRSLDYNTSTDILSLQVLDELFTVKLTVLNETYGKLILPFVRRQYVRRLRLVVAAVHNGTVVSEPTDMTHGQLGKTVLDMYSWVKQTQIDNDHPMLSDDLVEFARRVKINDDTCIWLAQGQTLVDLVQTHIARLVPFYRTDDPEGEADPQICNIATIE